MNELNSSNGTQAAEERIAPSRVDGEALRLRIGRWHSTCADCSD